MSQFQRHRRHVAGLALVAMLALALLPTVSRALAFAAGTRGWAEVCTPQGLKTTPAAGLVDAGQVPLTELAALSGRLHGSHLDACALCVLASAATMPAAARPAVPVRLGVGDGPQHPPRLAALPSPEWRHAQARAPPRRA